MILAYFGAVLVLAFVLALAFGVYAGRASDTDRQRQFSRRAAFAWLAVIACLSSGFDFIALDYRVSLKVTMLVFGGLSPVFYLLGLCLGKIGRPRLQAEAVK